MPEIYDRSSHWLISHHGDSILRLAGLTGFTRWRAVAANVVQPRRLPDGLLELFNDVPSDPDLALVEISTYPERRVPDQMLQDAMLVYLDRRILPELVTLVLAPRGTLRLSGSHEVSSRTGGTRVTCQWRVVNLWELPAEALLATGDVGVIPWASLARIDGPVESVLEKRRERIDSDAVPNEKANLLAVCQVLMRLRYNEGRLFDIFGGEHAMIESPMLTEFASRVTHRNILRFLSKRFGTVPADISVALRTIYDEERLDSLVDWAVECPDLDGFRQRLISPRE